MPRLTARFSAFLVPLLAALPARAGWIDLSQHTWSFVAEAGPQFTPVLNISGANQSNATANWGGVGVDGRLEAWLTRPDKLNLGVVIQPVFETFKGNLTSNAMVKGQRFLQGAPASLDFQFPSVRVTANYPVWSNGTAELRLGGSIILRYAAETLTSGKSRAVFTNTLALPMINAEATARLGGPWSAVFRADLLPSWNATGLYDAFLGVRYAVGEAGRAVEFGSRTFYGGFEPNDTSFLNNKVLFQSVVVRLIF